MQVCGSCLGRLAADPTPSECLCFLSDEAIVVVVAVVVNVAVVVVWALSAAMQRALRNQVGACASMSLSRSRSTKLS